MKNILSNSKVLIALFGFVIMLSSCEYQELADAEYPDQKLYMPAALKNNVFTIDNVPQRVEFLPTPGMAYNFIVDASANKFIVPLSVYRSGIDRKGDVNVDVSINNEIVPTTATVLPSDKYSVPGSVVVVNGEELGSFNLEIDLNYLREVQNTIYGVGVKISSSQAEVNEAYAQTAVVINNKFLWPVANFTTQVDTNDSKKITFTNSSTYGMTYSWDFGDGSSASTEKSPVHTYTSSGTYTVQLTTFGVTGELDKSIKTLEISVE